jgi:beta-xylosidase
MIYKYQFLFFKFIFLSSILLFDGVTARQRDVITFKQGEVWRDEGGNPINAHGAGILRYQNQYFLYGEIKKGKTTLVPGQSWSDYRVPAGGVSCYSSYDLRHWTYKGVALVPNGKDSADILNVSKVLERPKVIYNETTRKFVMWLHVDNSVYSLASIGVAESDRPEGPFRLIAHFRPNGNESRDMTIFKDVDGSAYLIYSSEKNATMHICKLSDNYLTVTSPEQKVFIGMHREAPAMFRSGEKYYLITSATTGWAPNKAVYAVADHPLSAWDMVGNPCVGKGAENTFSGQSTYVLPLSKNRFLFMADRWNMTDLENSRYLWLPMIAHGDLVKIWWEENVNLQN